VPRVVFTANLQRHVASPTVEVPGATVREALDRVFAAAPALRSYVLDDQGRLRKHMSVFLDGEQVQDRAGLSDRLRADSEIYVMQALSGG
jgi:sulfur-carrier protein